jgi:hypothetical protein
VTGTVSDDCSEQLSSLQPRLVNAPQLPEKIWSAVSRSGLAAGLTVSVPAADVQ